MLGGGGTVPCFVLGAPLRVWVPGQQRSRKNDFNGVKIGRIAFDKSESNASEIFTFFPLHLGLMTYDDNDSVKTRFSDLEPVYLVACIHAVFAIVFEIKNNDWTISSQNGFVCSWLALLLLRCRFKYMISNAKSYRDFRETRAPGTIGGRSKINRSGQVVRNGKLKRERGSVLRCFSPYPKPLDVFSCSLFFAQSTLSEHLEVTKTSHSRCQRLWLACSVSVCNSENLECVQTPPPLRKNLSPIFLRGGGPLYTGYDNQVLSYKWSWDANFFLEHASLLLKTIPNLSLVLFNGQCKYVFLRCFRTFHKLLP